MGMRVETRSRAHCRGALIQDGVCGVMEQQAGHGQALLFSSTQRLSPVLHLIPAFTPARRRHTASGVLLVAVFLQRAHYGQSSEKPSQKRRLEAD